MIRCSAANAVAAVRLWTGAARRARPGEGADPARRAPGKPSSSGREALLEGTPRDGRR